MRVKIKKLNDKAVTPQWNNRSAGCDLFSTEDYTLKPGERHLFKTGLSIAIPAGLYGRVAPRSGLAFKNGIDVLAGVIDEDYRGEIGVILINLGQEDKVIATGDKIAQLIFENYTKVNFEETDNLDETTRGAGGYGSTDKVVDLRVEAKAVKAPFTPQKRATIYQVVNAFPNYIGLHGLLEAQFRNYDGDVYTYTENGKRGACIIDSSGQVLSKFLID